MSDELLVVLSRRGQVAWPTCRRYIEELFARTEDGGTRPRYLETVTMNALQSLGHVTVDFADGSGMVRVAPRVLARLPVVGRPAGVLVGHRTSDTSEVFRQCCAGVPGAIASLIEDRNESPFVPRRLCVEVNVLEDLATLAAALEARFDPDPPAWRILQVASTIDSYRALLMWRVQRDSNWERRDFHVGELRWVAIGSAGDGLAEFADPQSGRKSYRLRRAERVADVERAWGCYVVLAATQRHVLYYDDGMLYAPLHARLPIPFDTALTLCSGLAPRVVSLAVEPGCHMPFFRYNNIPRPIAELAAAKLGQQLIPMAPQEP